MRKIVLFGFVFIGLMVAAHTSTTAQRKLINYGEYYEGTNPRPALQWYQRSRRVETTDETLEAGGVTKSHTIVRETLLPDRTRFYSKTVEGGKVTEYEEIKIGFMLYTRKGQEPWTKVDLRTQGTGTGSGYGSGSGSATCSQYSVENTVLNGIPAKLFEWISIESRAGELLFSETRSWIGEDGLPYRNESLMGKLNPRSDTSRHVMTYDYDPNIQIEAPIK